LVLDTLFPAPAPGVILAGLAAGLVLIAAAAGMSLGWRLDGRMRRRWQAVRGRAALTLPRMAEPPVPAEVAELTQIVTGLVRDGRLETLGAVLRLLATRPVDAADGRRLHDVAVDAALAPLERTRGLTALRAALAPWTATAEAGTPALVALAARALAAGIDRAEAQEGEAGRAMARGWAAEIGALARSGAVDAEVLPLLGEALYRAADDLPGLCAAFRRWQAADPGNARPYVVHAARLAALGPVAEEDLARHLAEAVAAARLFGGPGPMLRARLAAAEAGGRALSSLPGHAPRRILVALEAVTEGPGGQEIVNAVAARALQDGDESLARAVVARHLTLWILSLWPDQEGFLALHWRAVGRRPDRPGPLPSGGIRRALP
jgi:hypothetical protein